MECRWRRRVRTLRRRPRRDHSPLVMIVETYTEAKISAVWGKLVRRPDYTC